jgi:hypothetical protein
MGIKRGKYIYEDGYAVASDHREDEDEGYRQEEVTNIRGGETAIPHEMASVGGCDTRNRVRAAVDTVTIAAVHRTATDRQATGRASRSEERSVRRGTRVSVVAVARFLTVHVWASFHQRMDAGKTWYKGMDQNGR